MTEYDVNQAAAGRICRELEFNGRRFEIGECVAPLDGKVVSVEATLDDALRSLRKLDSNPTHGIVLQVVPASVDITRSIDQ